MRSKILFWGPLNSLFFSWPPRWGPHSGSRFGVYKSTRRFFSRNACRMRERLCQNFHSDPITKCLLGDLWFMFRGESSAWHCLRLFQALADALRVNATIKELYLRGNPIGDAGVKAWWLQRGEFGGPSRSSRSNGSISVVPEFVAVMSLEPLSK